VSEYLDGQISGPKFTQASVEELQKLPLEKVVVRRLRDFVSDKSVPYLVFAQDLYLEENESPYRFVGGISQQEIYRSRRMLVNLLALANFIVFFTIFTLISKLVKRLIVDSVYAVNESLERITKGNLNERVDVKVSREFVDLSNGVNATVDSLKQVVDEVKQSVERELVLAKKIQEASLPNIENLYSDRDEFDVYAKNRPMRSVGGDMYDFFYLDPENILFYIADVSGHGVPGALIMMKTMALVKNLALSGYPLEKVVALTNASLSENNDSSFVTGFFCVINLKTGDLTYVNAGHNSPFIRQGSGQFVEFTPEINLILGILPEAEYVSQTIKLNPGDVFVLFTDGITEATTPTMAGCFETDAALNVLNSLPPDATAKESVEALFEAVAKFTNYEEPSDDETILFFHYLRPSS
jgi:serine phosphatase RsbU (regulator of sigma subunit)